MAEIIGIGERLFRRKAEEVTERREGGEIFRIRLCGPDRRWLEAVCRFLGRALNLEGFYTTLEEPAPVGSIPAVCSLRAGREIVTESGDDLPPGLVVSAGRFSPSALRGCGSGTVFLLEGGTPVEAEGKRLMVPLPLAAAGAEALEKAAACAGGAARLLGVVRWTALEQALREELNVCPPAAINRHLAMALEAFDRTAPWAGRVSPVWEEVEEQPEPM